MKVLVEENLPPALARSLLPTCIVFWKARNHPCSGAVWSRREGRAMDRGAQCRGTMDCNLRRSADHSRQSRIQRLQKLSLGRVLPLQGSLQVAAHQADGAHPCALADDRNAGGARTGSAMFELPMTSTRISSCRTGRPCQRPDCLPRPWCGAIPTRWLDIHERPWCDHHEESGGRQRGVASSKSLRRRREDRHS